LAAKRYIPGCDASTHGLVGAAEAASQIRPPPANYKLRRFLHPVISFASIAMRIAVVLARPNRWHGCREKRRLTGRRELPNAHGMSTSCRLFALLCLLLALPNDSLRGELQLTNFTAANPLKIMAVGDSITDDCVLNGAWRAYLQPLLETNGFSFTFVGRQNSPASGGFTKTQHEGYCGSVVAAPGVMTSAVHGYAGNEVYLQKILADALTNLTPDLVLVLMGANDIGRGRNPWLVATNDLPALLDLIVSNAPNTHILLDKTMTLQNAITGSLNYGAFATNVPIYNAALQTMVNQRRALGQNVFLADMFSVVDYATMFNADHLHPNAAGLQAIAKEWLRRIQTLTVRPDFTTAVLVKGGSTWKFSDAGVDLGTNWISASYDDSGWSSGPAKLGYGDLSVATAVSYGAVSTNKQPTTYFRHKFITPANVAFTNLVLRLAQAHGSVVWLNGQELWRTNLPAGPIVYTNFATKLVGLYAPYSFNAVTVDATKLLPGTNTLAIEVHQFSPFTAAMGFDLELIGTGQNTTARPTLNLTPSGSNLLLSWPADVGNGFQLYQTTNLSAATWTSNTVPAQNSGGQMVVTQALDASARFFRLQKQ
jgi:lysophospholipase L1-like esterase